MWLFGLFKSQSNIDDYRLLELHAAAIVLLNPLVFNVLKVGFNAGDGILFYILNASRTPEIFNVTKMSNVNIPGKFAFRVDGSDIMDGRCTAKSMLVVKHNMML